MLIAVCAPLFVIRDILLHDVNKIYQCFIHGNWAVSNAQRKKEVQLIAIHFYGARTYSKLS